jgi:putative ABC transport system permease protein
MQEINPGFNPNNGLIMSFDLGLQGYDEKRGMSFYRQLLDRAKSLPGVKAASLAMRMPLNARGTSRVLIAIEGRPSAPGETLAVNYNVVGPDYLEAMGIPLARGRGFTSQDAEGAQPVIMINEHMGKRLWPGEDPIGKRISIGGPNAPYREIVGVVGNGKYYELTEPQIGQLYLPLYQNYKSSVVLVTRTEGDPLSRLAAVKNEVNALDKDLPVFDVRTLNEHMKISLLIQRFLTVLLGVFGLLAFALSAMGTYSVISYNTGQRLREYAIRTALGASRRDILRQIVGGGVKLVAIGVAIGLLIALLLGVLLANSIYGVDSYDPVTFTSIVLLMAAVAVIASYVPARKALKVNPVSALRAQ